MRWVKRHHLTIGDRVHIDRAYDIPVAFEATGLCIASFAPWAYDDGHIRDTGWTYHVHPR